MADAIGDNIAEGGISIWTHFGGNLVSPKWMIKHDRDIWVVKCPFSAKTDRVATQQSCALDYPEVARTISLAVWWAGRITKTRPDKKPTKRTAQQKLRLLALIDAQHLLRASFSLNDVIPAEAQRRAGTSWGKACPFSNGYGAQPVDSARNRLGICLRAQKDRA